MNQISLLLLFVLLLLLYEQRQSSYVVTDTGEVLVALNWHPPKKPKSTLHFYFNIHDEDLDSHIWNFCELKTVGFHYCSRLFAYIQKLQRSLLDEQRERNMIDVKYEADVDVGDRYPSPTRNKGLARHRKALYAEMEQQWRTIKETRPTKISQQRSQQSIQTMSYIEQAVTQVIWSILSRNRRLYKEIEAISFIHSVSYDEEHDDLSGSSKRELEIILHETNVHGLLSELDGVFVLHYGSPVSSSLISLYPEVTFIHVSTDTSFGQIPSLRIMRSIAVLLSTVDVATPQTSPTDDMKNPVHVLYMRTISTDFLSIHKQIEDWRALMLHFLVEKHDLCYELLESGDIDVVSVNYIYKPSMRSLHGNYWWATAKFIAQLMEIPYVGDRMTMSAQWLFTNPHVRFHVLHNSYENHEFSEYPRHCYRRLSAQETPSYQKYKSCGRGATLEKYGLLHNSTILNAFPIYHKDLHDADNSREITSSCSTFQLVTVFDS
jgi:hypothetical protein